MKRRVRLAAMVLLVTPLGVGAAQEVSGLDSLAWLAGRWTGTSGATQMEEVWMAPAGNVMVGMHRDVFASGRYFYESLRIEARDGEVVYLASPAGRQPPTPYRLVHGVRHHARFENPEHDFPQVLEYRLENDILHVTATGVENGRRVHQSWQWRRTPFPAGG